jgi:hypothetical protein
LNPNGQNGLCKPEVTGSIPVRPIAGRSPALGAPLVRRTRPYAVGK